MEVEILDSYSFEAFWDAYDKKVERIKCERKWNKLSSSDRQKALEYIPFYKQAQPNKQYRKNPDTFINNKSWNDELIQNKQQLTGTGMFSELQKRVAAVNDYGSTRGQTPFGATINAE